MVMAMASPSPGSDPAAAAGGIRSAESQAVATSRAMPSTDRQSGRFVVISRSSTASGSPSGARGSAGQGLDRADLEAAHGQPVSQLVDADRNVDELPQPRHEDSQWGNCSSRRKSLS